MKKKKKLEKEIYLVSLCSGKTWWALCEKVEGDMQKPYTHTNTMVRHKRSPGWLQTQNET